MPCVTRVGISPDFTYENAAGKKITDAPTLEYIKSLRIPPAYMQVEIHIATKSGSICSPVKLTYTGIDSKQRKQYGYSATHKARAAKEKFGDLIEFGRALPKIRTKITEELKDPNATRNASVDTAIALLLRIVLMCHFRLGNLRYKELYKSYGVSTLEVRHLKFVAPTTTSRLKVPSARFDFIGKKSVRNQCDITEPDVIHHLANIVAGKNPKQPIFTTHAGAPIKAAEINIYLKQFGLDLSSKQFRTYAGSTMLIAMLNAHAHRGKKVELPESLSVNERKKSINIALDITSETIHNTRAVCKREYCHPDIINLYLQHPRKYASIFMRPGMDAERAFMDYMMKNSSAAASVGGEASMEPEPDPEAHLKDPSEFWFS